MGCRRSPLVPVSTERPVPVLEAPAASERPPAQSVSGTDTQRPPRTSRKKVYIALGLVGLGALAGIWWKMKRGGTTAANVSGSGRSAGCPPVHRRRDGNAQRGDDGASPHPGLWPNLLDLRRLQRRSEERTAAR